MVIGIESLVRELSSRPGVGQALFLGLSYLGLPRVVSHSATGVGARGQVIVTVQVFSFWRPWGFGPLET